jgi:hypothetical protein
MSKRRFDGPNFFRSQLAGILQLGQFPTGQNGRGNPDCRLFFPSVMRNSALGYAAEDG